MRAPGCGALAVLLLASGCAVGPDYRRPEVPLAAAYHRAPPGESARSIADLGWWEVFGDPQLIALIDESLRDNLDLAIAATQIVQAQTQVTAARAPAFPQLAGALDASRTNQNPASTRVNSFIAALSLSWEIDFWGRYLRATEAARATLLATEEARNGVIASLVASVAQQYLQLNGLRERLEIVRRTADAQRASLRLVSELAAHGVQSAAEVRQAQSQLLGTESQIPALQLQIGQTEDALAILLGKSPRSFATGASLARTSVPLRVPPGVPSELLARRPDIRQAEQQLIAANANVGVAKARFFPRIALTGSLGRASDVLHQVLGSGGRGFDALGATVDVPLFTGGALVAGYEFAQAQAAQAALAYRRTILVALQEVSDALVAFDRDRAEAERNRERIAVNAESLRLAQLRFRSGVISYIEVLDAQRQLLSSQLDLNASELNQRLSAVQLYRALGGGWNRAR